MKYSVEIKYIVVENDYQTEHMIQTIYSSADAVMCLIDHLNQLGAETNGIIVSIQASVKEITN